MSRSLHLGYHLGPRQVDDDAPYAARALVDLAVKAEDAGFDALFRADGFDFAPASAARYGYGSLDPLLAFASVAAATRNIGLVATASTTFNQPYSLARQFLSLDHLSGGRAGWNAVTSFSGERAFGDAPIPDQDARYDRAEEFLEVVHGLWGTWEPDARAAGRRQGRFADVDKVHRLEHRGEHFAVSGTSPLPPSPQGRPVQFQAGASGAGKLLAARHAEAVYSASPDLDHARAIYTEFKGLVAAQGRDPERFLVFPGASLVLGRTREHARERYHAIADDLDVARALLGVGGYFGDVDLSGLDLDAPIPVEFLPADTSTLRRRRSRAELLKQFALVPGHTLRDVLRQYLIAAAGHFQAVVTYAEAADVLERWFTTGAADGFLVSLPGPDDQFDAFVEHVVPRLQDRGLFRASYAGSTLRENLGLHTPDVLGLTPVSATPTRGNGIPR